MFWRRAGSSANGNIRQLQTEWPGCNSSSHVTCTFTWATSDHIWSVWSMHGVKIKSIVFIWNSKTFHKKKHSYRLHASIYYELSFSFLCYWCVLTLTKSQNAIHPCSAYEIVLHAQLALAGRKNNMETAIGRGLNFFLVSDLRGPFHVTIPNRLLGAKVSHSCAGIYVFLDKLVMSRWKCFFIPTEEAI